jgi:putative ABC transport system permease protein
MITSRLREWMVRLWGTLGGRRGDADLEAELRSHEELASAERRGSVAQAMDALRDQRGLPWIDDFAHDMRHAARLLRRTPVFSGVAVLSLALGIGANSAIFSLADVLLLRPLPVSDPASILTVNTEGPEGDFGLMSYPNYRDLRERTRSFDGLVAYTVQRVAVSRSRDASREMRRGMLVSDNFFSVLGVQPALGRSFSRDEAHVPGRDAVVVLSDDYWKNALGADPAVLNGELWMNGVAFHVIGIAPPGFTPTEPVFRPAFYVPVTMAARLDDQSRGTLLEKRDARAFDVKGRLATGASRQSARAELTTLWEELVRQFPETNAHQRIVVRTELEYRIQSDPWDAITMALLFALVALVLVIGCANVANLMLGRVRVRSREMAVRLALGVSRARLVRQLLTESLLLSLMGCAAGLAFAYVGIRFLQTIPSGDQVVIAPGLDHRVLIFSVIAAVASAALFGLAPLRQSLATNLVPALKASESTEHPRGRMLGRNTIVIAQVAMSLVLLVATAMFFDGFRKALVLDPGFRTDHLMMLSLDPSLVRYTPEQTRNFYRELVDRVQALTSVRSATLTSAVPFLVGDQGTEQVVPEGYRLHPGQESLQTSAAIVDDRYFETMRIAVIRGRAFTAADTASSRGVAVVNEEFAHRYWPNQDPIGKRIRLFDRGSWLEVVGLTRTGKYTWIAEAPTPFLYLPLAQQPRTRMSLVVESTMADAGSLASPLRDAVRALDVTQPIANVQTLSHLYEERAFKVPAIIMQTVGAICLLGLALALIGLYGLVAYSVSRRTREIGIRMAIGAARSDVLSMVLRQGLLLSLIGVGVGGAASVVVGYGLSAALVGLGTPNPAIYVIVPIVLIGLTAAASYVPARRASRVDPLSALRDE